MGLICSCISSSKVSEFSPKTHKITVSDFTMLRAIGKGAFGKVIMIEQKKTKHLYAMKLISKNKCIRERAVKHIIQERNMLEEINCAFICNLKYSFQDKENMYMVMDLMCGGDLRFHMKRPIDEGAAKIIMAELSLALEYLHSRNIVHRDIKPDNILLDNKGHVYLTDFNITLKYQHGKPIKSIAGTEPYMAPELLTGEGYYNSVDLWSLGVVLFEMIYSDRPFKGKNKREKIKRGKFIFPEGLTSAKGGTASAPTPLMMISENEERASVDVKTEINKESSKSDHKSKASTNCKSLISGLLELDITKRLGVYPDNTKALKNHPFFASIDWDLVERKEVEPKLVPSAKSNFDPTVEMEDALGFNSSDDLKKDSKKDSPEYFQAKMQLIEKKFLYYNFENCVPRVFDSMKDLGKHLPDIKSPVASAQSSFASLVKSPPTTNGIATTTSIQSRNSGSARPLSGVPIEASKIQLSVVEQ